MNMLEGNKYRGFTLIELIVVITAIGILATITTIGLSTFLADSRDSQRAAKATVIAEALEKYYDRNGEYPSCAAMTDTGTSITTNVLPGLDQTALLTPGASDSDTNSIKTCAALDAALDAGKFAYVGDGSQECQTGSSCLRFSIQYVEEGSSQVKAVESRRQTDIATSGSITGLSSLATGFQTVQLSWITVPNASSYKIERSATCAFIATQNLPDATTNATVATGLTPGSTYCFRVAPISGATQGSWTNGTSVSTRSLSTPSIGLSDSGLGAINVTWTDIAFEEAYSLEYTATNGTWTNPPIIVAANATSRSVVGLTPGTTYFFRLQATATSDPSNSDTSNYSTTQSRTTPQLATPVITATANSASQITVSWPAVSYAQSYTLQQSTNNSTWTTVSSGAISPRVVTGLSQATLYYYRLQAVSTSPADTSNWSSSTSATTIIPPPVCGTSTLNSNAQITIDWSGVSGITSYRSERSTNNATWTNAVTTSGTSQVFSGLNNGTTYYFRVQAVSGPDTSAWAACPARATGINGPTGAGWYAESHTVRARAGLPWMPGADPGSGTSYWTNGITIYGNCSPGATVVTRIYSYYAYSNNTSPNNGRLMDWTFGNQTRYVVDGAGSWKVWWQGWVGCQVGGTRVGDTYLGNAGPY